MPKISPANQAMFILCTFSLCFFVITAATFNSLGVVIPFMVQELGWDWTIAGLGFTFLALACGLSGYLPSITIERYGVQNTLLLGLLILALGFVTLALTKSPLTYCLGCILLGVGYVFVGSVPGTYIITHFFVKRATAFGFYYTVGGLGGVAGPFIVWLADGGLGNWRLHWMLTLGLMTFSVLLTLLALKFTDSERLRRPPVDEEREENANPRVYQTKQTWSFKQALYCPQYWIICAAYTSVLFVGTTVNSFSVSHLTQMGISFGLASSLLSAEALCNSFSRVIGGVIAEYFEPKFMLCGSLLLLLLGMLSLSFASSNILLIGYALAIGFGFGMTFLACTVLLIRYFGSTPYLKLFATMNMFATVAAAAPFVCGALGDLTGSFVTPFLIIAATPAIVLVLVVFMRPPHLADETETLAEITLPTEPTTAPDVQLHVAREA
ncbi:CynX/NimT family MFS transporter [Halioxenophilus aromaticivorans]|uniref:MFS transporter n=1 Tax=Halioxenophilus aromaticivorans TaxID=1306992 RepID=A0AAV3U6D4_9ALTE